jgi:outer membrane protein OmpA-like peptidoglycan-associated protein
MKEVSMKKLRMRIRWLTLYFTFTIAAHVATGQQTSSSMEPPDTLPPGSVSRVIDLVFRVEDIGGGRVESLGVRETDLEVRIDMSADVLFDFNKATILPKAQEALKQAAEVIRQKAKGTVRIEGHTDSIGSDRRNQRLSEQRAESVKAWLVHEEGLSNVSFTTRGFGAGNPVAPNRKPDGSDDPEGRQKNRRVEIIIAK